MTSQFSRLNPFLGAGADASSEERLMEGLDLNRMQGTMPFTDDMPLNNLTKSQATPAWAQSNSQDDGLSMTDDQQSKQQQGLPRSGSTGTTAKRANSSFSIPSVASSPPWEHQLNEKHLRHVPTRTETTRYFDRRRQTRRVFIECLFMWFWTAGICAALAGTMYGFSTLVFGLSRTQKYAYNSLITGLSIVLGLAFAAQFKQYAEIMRWRFLAAEYRSLQDFETVLGCDSYRNTLRIFFRGRRPGSWHPSKAQVVAGAWILVFVAFNVFVALLGLTYSIDVSEDYVTLSDGNVSVAELHYISSREQPDEGEDYAEEFQKTSANLWGQVGQNFDYYSSVALDEVWSPAENAVFSNPDETLWWYRFVDLSPNNVKQNVVSSRTVTSAAKCQEYKILFGGYAGYNTDDSSLMDALLWEDEHGQQFLREVPGAAKGSTTWMSNVTSSPAGEDDCGPRCRHVLALQTANNLTADQIGPDEKAVPKPRLWSCTNVVGDVANVDQEGYADPARLTLPDAQASYLAGAIGWSGSVVDGSDLETITYNGDSVYSPGGDEGDVDGAWMAGLLMKFTVGTLAAMDGLGGPRVNVTGVRRPGPAQVVVVKWSYAATILAGIPLVQFLLLLGVVWFSSKAIILEPSYLTAAHLLYPVIRRVGPKGSLLTVDEMAALLSRGYRDGNGDFKISYAVRPDPDDPGHHDTEFVRILDVVEESEGLGYIRGKMPEGRYD